MRGRAAAMNLARPSAAAAEVPGPGAKRDRQRAIRDLVASEAIGSQGELVDRLIAHGFGVTQATVSRDIAELGLFKAPRDGRHVYVVPESFGGAAGAPSATDRDPGSRDERLRRILADIPVSIGRSGLILLVTGTPGTASVIAQAIDESTSLTGQEGTLAGDNTLLVLFADEPRLLAWRERFDRIRATALEGSPA
jgi:transcriptional regulator of arginine metabolism